MHQELVSPRNSSYIALGTIVGAARALGQTIVAEGVERQDQVKVLSAIGCDSIQGYLFSEPETVKEIPGLVSTKFLSTLRHSFFATPLPQVKV